MSDTFKPGDRVFVKSGSYKDQHGKVTGETQGLFFKKVSVKLDESGKEEILEGDLLHEKLEAHEVNAEIEKVDKHFKEVLPKLPEPTGGQMKKEIPTHLVYLKNALNSKQKHRANQESTYLVGAIPSIRETESIPKEWGKDLEIGLDRIQHWIKKNL
ncbi:S24/S26 family peptidase [Brasilonema sp. CT11]|nr:S24/S26 family peptidase [Brasilonema sp. CT11]